MVAYKITQLSDGIVFQKDKDVLKLSEGADFFIGNVNDVLVRQLIIYDKQFL